MGRMVFFINCKELASKTGQKELKKKAFFA